MMAHISPSSFATALWLAIKSLSLDDTNLCIDNPCTLLEPGGKMSSILPNPTAYKSVALEAILLLHRYSYWQSPNDIIRASRIMLDAISLVDEPGYSFFFHLLATNSLDLFERTTSIQYLDRAIDLLEHFSNVQERGSDTYLMATVELSCACLQYSFTINNSQALQSALDILHEGLENSPGLQWISSFGDTRTILFLGDAIRRRHDNFGHEEDFSISVYAIKSVLDLMSSPSDYRYTSLQIVIMAVILILSETVEFNNWLGTLEALCRVLDTTFHMSSNDRPLPAKDILGVLSHSLAQCTLPSSSRPICLIHMADTLDRKGEVFNSQADNDNDSGWSREWESAHLFIRKRIEALQLNASVADQVPPDTFQLFTFKVEVIHRPVLGVVRFRAMDPVGTHMCTFKVTVAFCKDKDAEHIPELTGHYKFYYHLRNISKPLSPDELDHFIDHPGDFDQLFSKSEYFHTSDVIVNQWKQSPAIRAYLIVRRDREGINSLKQAGRQFLEVKLDREPAYGQLLFKIAADLRNYETDLEALGIASTLIKEFLRVQDRGSPRHLLGVIELGSSYVMEYLMDRTRPTLFALALELFRESVALKEFGPWIVEARKIIVLGRLLNIRFKNFEESNECLERTITFFTTLWDLLPVGGPFRASTLEIITISALLYLARTLGTDKWHAAMRLLAMALSLRIYGPNMENDALDVQEAAATSQDLLENGIYLVTFSLASEAMCLVHISDFIRSTVLDCSHHPGVLDLSLRMYLRNLRSSYPHNNYHCTQQEYGLISHWENEKTSVIKAIFSCAEAGASELESSYEYTPMSIFHYRASYITLESRPTSFNHVCLLRYYPTRTSCINDTPTGSTPPSPAENLSDYPVIPLWPDDLMSSPQNPLPNLSGDVRYLPSTIIPGIDTVIGNENHELFKMPLEPRTIRAFIRDLHSQIRSIETLTSQLSEDIIHQIAETVYWDAKDVQLGNRVDHLKSRTPYITRLGPLQALISRGPERSLELVEASRSMFWARLLRLRTTFDGLPEKIADELQVVARELDNCKSQSVASVTKQEMQRQFDLEFEFASLLRQARQVPGFENLLKPKGHEILMQASSEGPIVVLLGNDSTYAALIVRPSGVDSVFLPGLTDKAFEKLLVGLNRSSKAARSAMESHIANSEVSSERYGKPRKPPMPSYDALLDGLWQLIVKPIFEFIGLISNFDPTLARQRLWWCPTGRFAFLPIHAAGNNVGKPNAECVSKYVVSSYIPTLSALISARMKTSSSRPRINSLKALILAQPTTKGHPDLPMTLKELELAESLIPSELLLRIGDGHLSQSNTNRTVEEAMQHLAETSVLHLACHGHQDRADPLNSGFELQNGRLTVSKLISCETPHAILAFLSACESAANDLEIPDESLNLAAAMLYAGFQSVIGTMWTMNDNDGPEVARLVYEELFQNPARALDPNLIPYALDSAVQKLQGRGVHPSRWATYIHVGI